MSSDAATMLEEVGEPARADAQQRGGRVHRIVADQRTWVIVTWAAVAGGLLLRLLRYLDAPALWLDEAFLAINLIERPLGDLFGALQFLQSAPPGFIAIEKASIALFGEDELALRLFPLLASLVSVVLMALVARRVLAPAAAALAVVLFATVEPLLLHAAEVKPYSSDVLCALALVAVALRVEDASSGRRRWWLAALAAVSVVAVWVSFPAAFVVAGVVGALVVGALQQRDSRRALEALAAGGVAFVSFLAMYSVASAAVTQITKRIFDVTGIPGEHTVVGRGETVRATWSLFFNPGGFQNGTHGLAALLAVIGVAALVLARKWPRLVLLCGPALVAVAAAALGRFPLGGRFSLFLTPFLILLVARGVQAVVSWSRHKVLVGAALAVFLAGPPVVVAAGDVRHPSWLEDVAPLVQAVKREWRPGDTLYVYRNAQYALRYYADCDDCDLSQGGFPWPTRPAPPMPPNIQFAPALESALPSLVIGSQDPAATLEGELARLPTQGRLWAMFTHVHQRQGLDEEALFLRELSKRGRLVEARVARNARLYLIELGKTPE